MKRMVAIIVVLISLHSVMRAEERPFRAGDESLKYAIDVDDSERRGEEPKQKAVDIKKASVEILEKLRAGGGLKAATELNIESYFIIADAFEADGLLAQSVDCLNDLQHKLELLAAARAGKKPAASLIETEDDILPFRDAHNIHVFDDKYMAGAQPTERGYRWLKSKGVTTVISLRVPSKHEEKMLEDIGIKFVHIPWADQQPPTTAQVNEMLDTVKNSKGKVYQHCLRGIGRDRTMACCYMIANHGKSADELIKEGSEDAPRWVSDQKRDKTTGEPVQFKLLHDFEKKWKGIVDAPAIPDEKLQALIKQLGHEDFEKRDAAERELIKAGAAARSALEAAQKSSDAQVRNSAKRILEKIEDDSLLDERHFEKEGHFSFQPPKGWTIREFPGFKYKMAMGTPSNDFSSNMNVVDEPFEGTLSEYMKATQKTLEKVFQEYKVLSEGTVKLNSGEEASRLVISDIQNKLHLRQTFYCIKGANGKMLVITCTALSEKGEELDSTFEKSARTFRVEKE